MGFAEVRRDRGHEGDLASNHAASSETSAEPSFTLTPRPVDSTKFFLIVNLSKDGVRFMAYLSPHFEYDAFVSYSHGDRRGGFDNPLKAWTLALIQKLETDIRSVHCSTPPQDMPQLLLAFCVRHPGFRRQLLRRS
jgi:hypothetical protein